MVSFHVDVPMKPAGFHLLCVVLHVALQSDTLWCALKNQLRGRGSCRETQYNNNTVLIQCVKIIVNEFMLHFHKIVQLTRNTGEGIDDILKHWQKNNTKNNQIT